MTGLRLFGPGTARRMLVTQAALAGVIGLRIAFGPYLDLAGQPAALFRPVWFLRPLDAMPGTAAIVALQVVGTATAALAVVGWRRRASFPVAWVGLLVLAGLRSSRGKFLHNDALLLLAAVPFLLAPAARWRDQARSARFGWPVHTATVVVAGAYFFSGLAKVLHSGPAWVFTDNLRYVLYQAADGGKVRFPGVATWLADQSGLAHWLAAGVLLFELTFAAVLFGGRRTSNAYAAGAVALHAGTWLALGLDYWAWAAVSAVVLVDWAPVVERGRVAGLSRYRLGRPPRFSPDDGNRRPVADVVPAEWREKAEALTCENVGPGDDAVSPRPPSATFLSSPSPFSPSSAPPRPRPPRPRRSG
ncbi:MAG: hypothetical protein QOG82_2625 [Actinomycetota bacterium]|jgi:hypothetical protein|nr:hypothetical protein [Actinomycetota bacterium]